MFHERGGCVEMKKNEFNCDLLLSDSYKVFYKRAKSVLTGIFNFDHTLDRAGNNLSISSTRWGYCII